MLNLFYRQCFDYDWGLQDDFMGATKLSLTQLELNQTEEVYLKLTDPARPLKDLGELKIVVTLQPKTQEDKEQVRMSLLHFVSFKACERFFVDFTRNFEGL